MVGTFPTNGMGSKVCIDCHLAKPLSEFYPAGDYHQSRCKPCHNKVASARYHGLDADAKARRVATIKARKYGMTLEEMQEYVATHSELCDVCEQPDRTHRNATWTRHLTFDHDHETGTLRGMLCSSCNLALGHAKDNPDLLRKLANHVERFRQRSAPCP